MTTNRTHEIPQPGKSIQYVSDHNGTVQSVLVPIDVWRNLLVVYQVSEFDLPAVAQKSKAAPAPSLFGIFPSLAALEFGSMLEEPKDV